MKYKKTYTAKELGALTSWFRKHQADLPVSLQLDVATFIPNLPQTVGKYLDIVERHKDSATFGAQIFHLFKIKAKLEEAS